MKKLLLVVLLLLLIGLIVYIYMVGKDQKNSNINKNQQYKKMDLDKPQNTDMLKVENKKGVETENIK